MKELLNARFLIVHRCFSLCLWAECLTGRAVTPVSGDSTGGTTQRLIDLRDRGRTTHYLNNRIGFTAAKRERFRKVGYWGKSGAHFLTQPQLCTAQVAADDVDGSACAIGDLFGGESAEKAHFDEAGFGFVL